ncbi:hypothetical protein ACP_0966 [Acidobacterium capsulatum ATCC 51196]|uniref:Uncharacterized protein n=1 Tax=Acidobacterium capsulatum (strain ATCC 51196 / DSM 11244 / BCRC 80197 / JCM 7670 / NBRC 15755 / NCIMB 13165 / 161) TaxID=240015 RepID=C1F3H7_ACIC5|nr:hypothetical protein ACP_0966 [Acidobacterium capsulatum ATCC 51196]
MARSKCSWLSSWLSSEPHSILASSQTTSPVCSGLRLSSSSPRNPAASSCALASLRHNRTCPEGDPRKATRAPMHAPPDPSSARPRGAVKNIVSSTEPTASANIWS